MSIFDALSSAGDRAIRGALQVAESASDPLAMLRAAQSIARALEAEPVLKGDGDWRYAEMAEPRVLYRSVSPEEWEQIKKDGVIKGGLNTFNPFDKRREVFFGDTLNDMLIGQGEDITRRGEYAIQSSGFNSIFMRAAGDLRSIKFDINERARELGYESADAVPGYVFLSDKKLKALEKRRRDAEKELNRLHDEGRQRIRAKIGELRAADEKRGYSSVVLETKPITGGRVYSNRYGKSGMDLDEYGFDSGAVRLSDIVKVRFVKDKRVVDVTSANA